MSSPTDPPRVLQVITHFALGGAERVAATLLGATRGSAAQGVFAVHGLGDDAMGRALAREVRALGVPVWPGSRLALKHGGLLPAALGLARAIRAFRPDALHLHTEIPEAAAAALFALRLAPAALPVVRTVHNAVYWEPWRRFGGWCDRRLAHAQIAAVSHDAAHAFAAFRAGSGAPPPARPPVVIYNGVPRPLPPAPDFRPLPRPVRVLFGGRLARQKGADLLPAILAGVSLQPGQPGELEICGDGPLRPSLARWAAAPPAGWTVRLAGVADTLAGRIRQADVVIVPSRFEGLSLVAVEAQLAGKPVVATAAPGLREALPPDYPWRARPGDAADFARQLQQALAGRAQWPDTCRRARIWAEARFDPAAMATAYLALYARALGPSQPA